MELGEGMKIIFESLLDVEKRFIWPRVRYISGGYFSTYVKEIDDKEERESYKNAIINDEICETPFEQPRRTEYVMAIPYKELCLYNYKPDVVDDDPNSESIENVTKEEFKKVIKHLLGGVMRCLENKMEENENTIIIKR